MYQITNFIILVFFKIDLIFINLKFINHFNFLLFFLLVYLHVTHSLRNSIIFLIHHETNNSIILKMCNKELNIKERAMHARKHT